MYELCRVCADLPEVADRMLAARAHADVARASMLESGPSSQAIAELGRALEELRAANAKVSSMTCSRSISTTSTGRQEIRARRAAGVKPPRFAQRWTVDKILPDAIRRDLDSLYIRACWPDPAILNGRLAGRPSRG